MARDNLALGKYGEELAAQHLQKQGYKILARNFQKRYGEIDIVAQEGNTLVFVEVKTRIGDKFGPPEEAITPWKLQALIRSAQYYKMLHPELPESLRVDVVALDLSPAREVRRMELIKNITG